MTTRIAGFAVLGLLAFAPPGVSLAQTTPVAGANSFTEGQAQGRIENAGYADVTRLQKDDQGIWRGRATRNGTSSAVALDYQGNVVSRAAASATASPTGVPGSAASGTPRDGMPGNPPSTAVGRAVDTATGARTAPDGTSDNPAGTAASRAVDGVTGTNLSGANPGGATTGGTPGNPPGTAAGRAVDRTLGTNSTGSNPGGSTATPTR